MSVPTSCPGIDDPSILKPANTWDDPSAYEERAKKLARDFAESYEKAYGDKGIDAAVAADAARVSSLAKDVTEFMAELGLGEARAPGLKVAYHAACSLQHGQKVTGAPKALLADAGFQVLEPAEAHLCCGSAGTYNLLQPAISAKLKARKVANLEATAPQVISAGNIGCMMQIGTATGIPVVHTAELLDWATGGPKPEALADLDADIMAAE